VGLEIIVWMFSGWARSVLSATERFYRREVTSLLEDRAGRLLVGIGPRIVVYERGSLERLIRVMAVP